jgi:hypothetical protein
MDRSGLKDDFDDLQGLRCIHHRLHFQGQFDCDHDHATGGNAMSENKISNAHPIRRKKMIFSRILRITVGSTTTKGWIIGGGVVIFSQTSPKKS